MPECVTCVSLHGPPGCPASSITADGDPICIFCIDQLLCPVQKRMLANARSPLHSPRRFAIAHLLQGEKIPRAQAECEASAPAKPKTDDPAPTHSNGNAKHDGRRIGHHGSVVSARMLELRAARAAAAKPGSRNATSEPAHGNGAARSLGAAAAGSSPISKQNAHVANDSQEEKNMAITTTPAPTSATSTAPAARVCKIAGCKGQLGSQNQSGLCRKHRSHTAAAASPARSNGHANGNGHHAAKSNGSGKKNGHEDRLIARRVKALLGAVELPPDLVWEIVPEPDKKAFVESWLLAREGAA